MSNSNGCMRPPKINNLAVTLLLALAYFACGRLGLLLPAFGTHITLIWLPTGIAVAALLRWGFGCWPGIALGAFAVNITTGTPWAVAVGIAVGNTLAPLLAAGALQRMKFHPAFDRKRDILLLAAAAVAGMLVSSSLGTGILALSGNLPDGRLAAWLLWWAGDATGVISAAPLVLALTPDQGRAILRRLTEFLVWLGATLVVTWGVFVVNRGPDGQAWALAFLPLPLVAWTALRFGAAGTSLALIALSFGAAYGTASGRGPFFRANPIEGTVVLWIYMATSAVLGWLINALQAARVQASGVQRLFEGALTDVSLGVLLAGLDRRITYANHGFTRLTGYAEAEVLGKSCALLQGPKTDPQTAENLKAALHGDGHFDGEIRNYRKDGTTFWNALLISPVRDEHGAKTGFLGIQRDITQRKEAEEALQRSEEHLRVIIDLEPECVKILSPDGQLLEMNPAGLAMIEAGSLDEVRGLPVSELIVPEDRAAFAEAHQRALAGGAGRCEFRIVGLKGTRRWLETHAVPYRDSAKEIIGVLGITRDITERRQAAVELERSLSTLQLFVDTVPAYISFVDADERYRLVNQRYEEYFGRPAAELIGQRLCDVQPAAAYAEMQPHVRAALGGKAVRYQSNPTGPDGKTYWFDVQYVPRRGEDGAVTGFFVLVFDITENKLSEIALSDSRSRLDSILNSLQDVVWSSTPDGQSMLFVSASAQALYGRPASEFLDDPLKWLAAIHPEDRAIAESAFDRVAETGACDMEYRIVHADGTVRWVHDRSRIVRDPAGQALRLDGIMTDISARKQAELALSQSEQRYRQLFEANPHPMWVYDIESLRFLAVNAAAIAHYGYSRAEFLAMTLRDIRPPEDIPALLAKVAALPEGLDQAGIWRHRKRDGKIIEVEISSHVIEFDGRKAEVVLAHDVTERRRAETRSAGERAVLELMASGAPLSAVLDRLARSYEEIFPGMLCSVLLLDEEGRHLRHGAAPSLPEAFCRTVDGVEIGPAVGSCGTAAYTRQVTAAADISNDPRWTDYRDLALAHGLRACWSVPVISSQNRVLGALALYYREPATPRPEEMSAMERGAHFAGLALEREALKRSVEENQTRLETLVSNLPGMAYRCVNDPNWTMTYVSEGCEAVTGYRRDELENNRTVTYAELIHADDRDWLWAKCQKSLDARTPCQNEYRIIDRHRRERWVSERASGVYAEDGALLAIDGFIQDITAARQAKLEHEQLDRKLQEKQKLESLGVLAGGIAHDFNNLLTAILGNASIAASDLPVDSPVQECLDQITEASVRAADLCKQMLAYSGRGRFVVQKLDLGQFVEQTAQMLRISISKKAELHFQLQPGLPPIEADATQIRQVIMNLVINASEAIGDASGLIGLSTGLVHVDRHELRKAIAHPDLPEGEYVFLEVTDSGCGMSTATLARIFDPFFTTKFTGRGLGLAAVLGIVRGHKGALQVTSEVGRGTTFKLLFPPASGPSETMHPPPVVVPQWRGTGTVLVVDDEEPMRTTLARMLRIIGLEPVLAVDGREGVEIFRADPGRFLLVLLDLTMPHMDGEQAFAELRRIRPDVRVVLMSGFNAQEVLVRFSGKGLASFLQKPFTIDAVRATLREVLEEKTPPAK